MCLCVHTGHLLGKTTVAECQAAAYDANASFFAMERLPGSGGVGSPTPPPVHTGHTSTAAPSSTPSYTKIAYNMCCREFKTTGHGGMHQQ